MKRILTILVFLLLLIIPKAFAEQQFNPNTGQFEFSPAEQSARDALIKSNPDISIPPESTVSVVEGGFVIDYGPLTIAGKSIEGLNLQLSKDGKFVQQAVEFKSQGVSVSDATNIHLDKKFTIDAASSVKTDGKTPIAIGQAQLITAPGIIVGEGTDVTLENNELSLTNAKTVTIGDIQANEVYNAHFSVAKDSLSITSVPNTFFQFKDLFSTYKYHSLGENNFLRISKGVIEAKNVNLTVLVQGVGKLTESVMANSTAKMTVTKQGIQCLNSTDGFFSIHFSDPKQDVGFRQWTKQRICLRTVSSEHLDCSKNCALIDFVDSKIISQGMTDVERKFLFKRLTDEFHRFFASFDANATAVMDFSKDGITYDLAISCTNCHTHPNNYYSIYQLNNTYVWADPGLSNASTSTLAAYHSGNNLLYPTNDLRITNNELHYQHDSTAITFFPPQSQSIFQLIKDITTTTPVYLSIPLLMLIPVVLNRKAQLTMFFLLGLFILIAGALLIGVATIHPTKEYATTDTQSLVDSCLADSLKDTLLVAGRQGGILPLKNSMGDLNAPLLNTAHSEEQLLNEMEAPLLQAFEACMNHAKPRNVQVCAGKKSATFILTDNSMTAKLTHCYETTARTKTRITGATAIVQTNAKEAFVNQIKVLERSLEVNQQHPINLDQLTGTNTFFPYNNHLISAQQLMINSRQAWWVYGLAES